MDDVFVEKSLDDIAEPLLWTDDLPAVAAYRRVSSRHQVDEGYSLETQEMCRGADNNAIGRVSIADAITSSMHQMLCIGDPSLINRQKIGLLCSIQCPGDIILKTLDLMQELRNTEACVVSGFHSPLEQECLKVLLCGTCGTAICYSRSLPKRVPKGFMKLIDDGRLLMLSTFDERHNRATLHTSTIRNKVVATLADVIFVPYAADGGNTESLCREILKCGKGVVTFGRAHNNGLLDAGASSIESASDLSSTLAKE